MNANEINEVKKDFIHENIDLNDYLASLPPLSEIDLTDDLEYKQTEFKPTLFRYIRLMNKEHRDKNGDIIVPEFSYEAKGFSSASYSLKNENYKNYSSTSKDIEIPTIRRLQKTKLSQNSYPFPKLVPTYEKKDIPKDKTEQNIDKNLDSKKEEKDNKNVLNLSQRRHYDVQNFSIIILCLLINAFCCIIYYTNEWPDIVNRLPNQITLSKIIINNSFVFTGDRLYVQQNNNLRNADYQMFLKDIHYGDISIDASHTDSRVKCITTVSTGQSITMGSIKFTLSDDKEIVEMSTSKDINTITVNMNIDNVSLLDLSKANSIFGEDNFVYQSDSFPFHELNKESAKKTLLRRNAKSDQLYPLFYDTEGDEIFYSKLFEIKENTIYGSIFENSTLSLLHVDQQISLKQRPKINSNSNEIEKVPKFFIKLSIPLAQKVEAADIVLNDKIAYTEGKEIKFIYIDNYDFHLHLGKLYFDGVKYGKVLDFDLPKINLRHIYGDNREEFSKIKLNIDSKGFPAITLNEATTINCSHPLCLFEQYP